MSKTVITGEENKCNITKEKKSYLKLVLCDTLFIAIHIAFLFRLGDASGLHLIPAILAELIFCLIYMIIHGIVSYCVYRRVLYPHLITGAFLLISIYYIVTCPYGDKQRAVVTSMYLCFFLLCSFIVSMLTKLIFKLREWRRKKVGSESGPEDSKGM